MKTISERFIKYVATRYEFMPNKFEASEIMADAERLGNNPFDALQAYRDPAGLGIFGAKRQSDAMIRSVKLAFDMGKVPMYEYKPGKGRPAGAKNNPLTAREREMRAEIAALKFTLLKTVNAAGLPDSERGDAKRALSNSARRVKRSASMEREMIAKGFPLC